MSSPRGTVVDLVRERSDNKIMTRESSMLVRLQGKSKHGKNRIQQHGDVWIVVEHGRFGGQPAMMLCSMENTDRGRPDGRWVQVRDDKDFDWEIIND